MEKHEIKDLVNSNNTAYNNKQYIDFKSFSVDELNSLTIVREYQNLNNEFRFCLNPVDILKQEEGKIKIKDFLNVRKNIYKNVFNENKLFWNFYFNFSIFKGRNTDLFFIKIEFKKKHHFIWFFALMGLIKGNLTYKGEFTRKERRLLFKLKNPKSNYLDLEELKFQLFCLNKERKELKESYRLLKGLNKNLNRNFNKWGSWSDVPHITKKRFRELNLLKRGLKVNRLKIKKLKNIIFEAEDKKLNTNRLWDDY